MTPAFIHHLLPALALLFNRRWYHFLSLSGILIFLLLAPAGHSQMDSLKTRYDDTDTGYAALSPATKKKRQWIIGGINVAGYGSSLYFLNKAWYKNEPRTRFHTFNDSKEWLQMDKAGHVWTAANTSRASAAMWRWAGVPERKAAVMGGISSLVYLAGIEYLDAHSAKWGWSWSDVGANFTGAALFTTQQLLWQEQRVQVKFSFHPSTYKDPLLNARADDLYGSNWNERLLKDYNAQTYWLSANIRSWIPDSKWPAWLNIAAGYGAGGMFGGFENKWANEAGNEITRYDIARTREFYLAPDIDFTKIKTKSRFLRTAFTVLNAFKCPAPSLMLNSKGKLKFYPLYF